MNSKEIAVVSKINIADKTNSYRNKFKVIVIGDTNVGKTSLTYRLCEGTFLEYSEATIGVDFRTHTFEIDGEEITLQLWDTAGQEKFRNSLVRHFYRNANAIVLVYDITNRASFESLGKWIDECNINCHTDVQKILVGNKCDGRALVSTQQAQKFADQHNMPLFETSSRLNSEFDNINAIFITLAHMLKNQKIFSPLVHVPTLKASSDSTCSRC